MSNNTLAQKLAHMVYDIDFVKLDHTTVHMMKRYILDYIGTALAGVPEDASQTAVRGVIKLPGEICNCTVLGQTGKFPCATAALLNGIFGHAIEMDDDHRVAIMHAAAVVIPAAMAVAENEGSSGKEFIEAVLSGYEVAIRIGSGLLGKAMFSGWHPTGTCGVFGAAIAAGKLLKLNEEQLTTLIGIAGSTSSGLFEFKADGSWTKKFHGGKVGYSGIIAAYLAKEGYTGPATILEGDNGFFKAYSHQGRYNLDIVEEDLGTKYVALETSIKPYACGRFSQPIIDCSLELAVKYDLKPEDVKDVLVRTLEWTTKVAGTPKERVYKPQTVVDAQFSIPYAVAVSIVHRKARLKEFTSETIKDPVLLNVASKVRWEVDPKFEAKYPLYYPSAVTLWTNDNRKIESSVEFPKGDPENPMTDAELEEKFKDITARTVCHQGRIEQIIDIIWDLDQVKHIDELTRLL